MQWSGPTIEESACFVRLATFHELKMLPVAQPGPA
jgi:hypothetical protein